MVIIEASVPAAAAANCNVVYTGTVFVRNAVLFNRHGNTDLDLLQTAIVVVVFFVVAACRVTRQ
jgi:hypothetical protein